VKVTIIGYGMAGARVAAEIRARTDATITVFGAEPHRAYNRILLSGLLAGKTREDDLTLVEPHHGLDLRLGTEVGAIDTARRTVNGEEYDALVLATGSRALLPPVENLVTEDGTPPEGVSVFRTLDDCRRILKDATGAGTALVLGGGLLGLEAARGLAARGLRVTVVHAAGHLMERQLDPAAGAVLTGTLERLGITVVVDALAVARTDGGLRLEDGTELTADLLVVACGVRPETTLAARAGLDVNRGVVVDDHLRTSDPHIYAIGDCAEHRGTVYGLVAPAWEQAAVVAAQLAGETAHYAGSRLVTRLKAAGIDLAAMGAMDGGEVVSYTDPARGTYARLVIDDDRLAGAIMLGDNPTVGQVVQLFDRGTPVPPDRRALLLGRALGGDAVPAESPALMPDAAVVCRCNDVTKGAIVRCGARTVTGIAAATRATTGCGGCADAVAGIPDWLSTVDPVPADLGAAS